MTLGTSPQPADVVAELGSSLPYTFPDAATRWLADVGSTDSITFPTDFASKQSVKKVAGLTSLSTFGTSHSFSVSFGADYTGRLIFVIVFAVIKNSATTSGWTLSSGTIGGETAFGPGSMVWWQDGTGSNAFVGNGTMWAAPTGTSGTISFNTGENTSCAIVVLSMPNTSIITSDSASTSVSSTSASILVSVPANGILIAGATYAAATAIDMGGDITGLGREQGNLSGNYWAQWGWDNRLSANNYEIDVSSTTSGPIAVGASSRVQG